MSEGIPERRPTVSVEEIAGVLNWPAAMVATKLRSMGYRLGEDWGGRLCVTWVEAGVAVPRIVAETRRLRDADLARDAREEAKRLGQRVKDRSIMDKVVERFRRLGRPIGPELFGAQSAAVRRVRAGEPANIVLEELVVDALRPVKEWTP